jgi:hypothetical protein
MKSYEQDVLPRLRGRAQSEGISLPG